MSRTYKTLTGFHFLGMTENSGTINALLADGHIPMVAKFVQCDVGYIAGLHGSFPADTAFIVRWVYFGAWNSDNIDGWLAAHPNVATAALAWVDVLTPNLTALASIPRTVYVETFNEAEITPNLCTFNVAVAKLLKARYGEELKVAALSLGAGRYNERSQAQIIVDNLVRPLNALDIQYALSLHSYSSLAMPVWNGLGYYKHNIQEMFATGDPSKLIDLDTVPKVSLDAEPGAYTGFAHERLGYFLKVLSAPGERLHETPILLTETGIDAMQDPGIGTVAGGWREWWTRDLWSRVLRPNESPGAYYGRNLDYAERRYQSANDAGMNIQGATPFTYSDADTFSRWYRDYRVVGEAWEVFKERSRANAIEAPIPEEETLPTGITLYWPVEDLKRAFNQAYGANVPYYSQWGLNGHEGIDFYAPHGTNIYSCADGVVKVVNAPGVAGYQSGHNYGIHVRVSHEGGYETIYAHFEKSLVSVGDTVKASQVIGIADSTGNSTGSHLHLTLKKDGVIINPTDYLVRQHATPQTPTPVTCDAKTLDRLNIRSAPDASSKTNIIFTAELGATLSPTHQFITRGENWYRVIYTNDGIIGVGWCVARFTTRAASCPVLPVWVEPTPEPQPEPEPEGENAAVIAELMPVFRDIQAGALALQAHTQRAEAIFQKYVKEE